MDPDQTADLGPHCLSMRLQVFSWTTKNIYFVIMRFKGYLCVQCVYDYDFHEMHARLRSPKSLLSLYQIINKMISLP